MTGPPKCVNAATRRGTVRVSYALQPILRSMARSVVSITATMLYKTEGTAHLFGMPAGAADPRTGTRATRPYQPWINAASWLCSIDD